MGFAVTRHESQPHWPNVLGRLNGTEGGVSLMMNDYLDTYPAVELEKGDKCDGNPFAVTRHGDWLYARGNLAASLLAVKTLIDERVRPKGDLICCYAVEDEKDGAHGSIFMAQSVARKVDNTITTEPTGHWSSHSDWDEFAARRHLHRAPCRQNSGSDHGH